MTFFASEDSLCIDLIIKDQHNHIEELKEEIEDLREKYYQHTVSVVEESTVANSHDDESARSPDLVHEKEEELARLKNQVLVEEENYNRMWNVFQSSCNVASRIMFQLEPTDVS